MSGYRLQVKGDPLLVADNRGVVARWRLERLVGPDLDLHTNAPANDHATGDHAADVGRWTGCG